MWLKSSRYIRKEIRKHTTNGQAQQHWYNMLTVYGLGGKIEYKVDSTTGLITMDNDSTVTPEVSEPDFWDKCRGSNSRIWTNIYVINICLL